MISFVPVERDATYGRAAGLLAHVQKSLGSTPDMTKTILKKWPVVTQ